MYTNNHDAFTTLQDVAIYGFTDDVPNTWKFVPKICKVFLAFRTCLVWLRAGAVVLREEHAAYETNRLREHRIALFTRYSRTGRHEKRIIPRG